MSDAKQAVRHFDATEVNVAELERLLTLIFAHIGPGPSFIGDRAEYNELCDRFRRVLSGIPSIEGWSLRVSVPDIDDIYSLELDAALVQDPEITAAFEHQISSQDTAIAEYRHRLRRARKQRIADEIASAAEGASGHLQTAVAGRGTERGDAALDRFRGAVDRMTELLGPSLTDSPEWISLGHGIARTSGNELLEAVTKLWPEAKAWLSREVQKDQVLPKVEVEDLVKSGEGPTVGAKLRGSPPATGKRLHAADPLREFRVDCVVLEREDIDDLAAFLMTGPDAAGVMRYFAWHRDLLVRHLIGEHGQWVLTNPELVAQCAPDFVVGSASSIGTEWEAVVLGGAMDRMFEPDGHPTAPVRNAVRRIQAWRAWLRENQHQAQMDRSGWGLGLTGANSSMRALILIGMRGNEDRNRNAYLDRLAKDSGITLHSYDYLLEVLGERVAEVRELGNTPRVIGKREGADGAPRKLNTPGTPVDGARPPRSKRVSGRGRPNAGRKVERNADAKINGLIEKPLTIIGQGRGAKYAVRIGATTNYMNERQFVLLLRLVHAALVGGDGWVTLRAFGGPQVAEGGEPQAISRLRAIVGKRTIQTGAKKVRLAIVPTCLAYDRDKLMKCADEDIVKLAGMLP